MNKVIKNIEMKFGSCFKLLDVSKCHMYIGEQIIGYFSLVAHISAKI